MTYFVTESTNNVVNYNMKDMLLKIAFVLSLDKLCHPVVSQVAAFCPCSELPRYHIILLHVLGLA